MTERAVRPRISLILGVDTNGSVYYSFTQVNTDSDVFKLFLSHLVQRLDTEDQNWRSDTVVLFDNASYHTSSETNDALAKLNIPTMFSAPYSFETAPCELFFAHMKMRDLNPDMLPTGKK